MRNIYQNKNMEYQQHINTYRYYVINTSYINNLK